MSITPIFLEGSKQAGDPSGSENLKTMTTAFCDFVAATQHTLHIAAYHFKFNGDAADQIRQALANAAEHADVKLAYYDEPKRNSASHRAGHGGDMSGPSTFPGFDQTRVQLKAIQGIDISDLPEGVKPEPIEGGGALMHSKYMIRDGSSVWMGTANFTEDGWGLQDNNVLIFDDAAEFATYYETDFGDLWRTGRLAGTGKDDFGSLRVAGEDLTVDFSPGDGKTIEQRLASLVGQATRSLAIASMDISSGPVLEALEAAIGRNVDLVGVYDGPQMEDVEQSWSRSQSAASAAKLATWNRIKPKLVAKPSRKFDPHAANAEYNFMHNKTLVVDDTIVHTGSFNFSGNATRNAENVVELTDPDLAGRFAAYITALVTRYRP